MKVIKQLYNDTYSFLKIKLASSYHMLNSYEMI